MIKQMRTTHRRLHLDMRRVIGARTLDDVPRGADRIWRPILVGL